MLEHRLVLVSLPLCVRGSYEECLGNSGCVWVAPSMMKIPLGEPSCVECGLTVE